jgi:hypothetical protein
VDLEGGQDREGVSVTSNHAPNSVQTNLNKLRVITDEQPMDQVDHSVFNNTASCYFKQLDFWLTKHIREADYVFGCVAWLTEAGILFELAKKRGVCLLVQKEDFLRPDSGQTKTSAVNHVRAKYATLHGVYRPNFHGLGRGLSSNSAYAEDTDPVRCVGVRNKNTRAAPRMHHKFALFAKATSYKWNEDDFLTCPFVYEHKEGLAPEENEEPPWARDDWLQPYAVWTGSFNWTFNAGNSLENAVVLRDSEIVAAYYNEFQQILALSEPLDWESDYVEPEWRIGT